MLAVLFEGVEEEVVVRECKEVAQGTLLEAVKRREYERWGGESLCEVDSVKGGKEHISHTHTHTHTHTHGHTHTGSRPG